MRLFEKSPRKPSINLTPLIDILFILIIFFVVSSKIAGNQGIGITLPKSNQSQEQIQPLPILHMTADQQLIFNNTRLLKANLYRVLTEEIPSNQSNTLILKIDERVPHGVVIELMDLVKSAGYQKIVFGTEPNPVP
ncbi:MAG: biopolymer transporter ExbD [SAR324 cluster bacterium]|nr:biopolymer transporter ExbD [SAR324 cluster bacterium]